MVLEVMINFIEEHHSDFDLNKAKFKDSVFRFCFESVCLSTKEINFQLVSKLLSFLSQDSGSLCVYMSALHKFFSFDDTNPSHQLLSDKSIANENSATESSSNEKSLNESSVVKNSLHDDSIHRIMYKNQQNLCQCVPTHSDTHASLKVR